MDIQDLVNSINGKLYGNKDFFSIDGFTGKMTFLHDAHTGDIVIREEIDSTGVEMAFNKNIACLITPNPKDGAIETAQRLGFPLRKRFLTLRTSLRKSQKRFLSFAAMMLKNFRIMDWMTLTSL